MTLVWALVRGGPNFDGRQVDVQRAVAATIDNAAAAERERSAAEIERLREAMREALPFTMVPAFEILNEALGPNV